MNLTKQELSVFAREQKRIFDVVRLVDVTLTLQYTILEDGSLHEEPYKCYAFWRRNSRCENCASSKALSQKCKTTKFEFFNNEIYFVISVYAKVDGVEYVIELVSKLNDNTLFDAYGRGNFIKTVEAYNKKLYIDSLTGAYNRRYFDEQLKKIHTYNGIVMIDVDNLKMINDTFGHAAGDYILSEIGKKVNAYIKTPNAFIRLGGDEFLMVFYNIAKDDMKNKLDCIMQDVSKISVAENPEFCVSVSMGAVYSKNPITEGLIPESDKALYEAKKQKNKVVFKEV